MKRFIALILSFILLIIPVFAEETAEKVFSGKFAAYYANSVVDYIDYYYKFDTSTEKLYKAALETVLKEHPEMLSSVIESMTEDLDKYSTYLDPEEYSSWLESLSGSFAGIGVTIEQRGDYIVVVSPIEGSGAELAGVLPGDKIVSVNGEDVVGQTIETVRTKIVGEVGTPVNIGVLRGEEAITFTISRCIVEQTTVSHAVTEDDIGYIVISNFAETTPEDVSKALKDFDSKKIKKLIIDVRNNPGGELNALLDTLRLFMPKGDILHINYKNEQANITYTNNVNNSKKYEIVVLANENSASAAEAFAGSMKDKKVAKIVGKTTFGKGSMQTIQPVITGGALKLTVALYQSAGGSFVDGVGVAPDYRITNSLKPLHSNPDFLPMQFSLVIDENSSPEAIEAAELRLKLLSIYPGKVDGVFDADTKAAVTQFQTDYCLDVTGQLDISTQTILDNLTRDIKTSVDNQYKKAVELLTD